MRWIINNGVKIRTQYAQYKLSQSKDLTLEDETVNVRAYFKLKQQEHAEIVHEKRQNDTQYLDPAESRKMLIILQNWSFDYQFIIHYVT